MKKKQILAALLAAACAVSMAVPTFALTEEDKDAIDAAAQEKADGNGGTVVSNSGSTNVTVDTEVQKPTLAVVLPTTVKVFVNPYRAEVAVHYTDPADPSTADRYSIDTVLSPEMEVNNFSDCAVKIGVKGSFLTYQYLSSAADLNEIEPDAATDATGLAITGWNTLSGTVDNTKLYADTNTITTAKNYYAKVTVGDTAQYRLVTVKKTNAVTTAGKEAPAKLEITGYTASKTIKVGTAAIKDEDTEKNNTIFMYVEGSLESGVYPAYAKSVAGVKDTKTGNISKTGQFALSAKEASQAVLYLEGGNVTGGTATGTTGYIRVSGNAATAPTVTWSELEATDGFETPFVFTVDPVANPKDNGPQITKLTYPSSTEVTPASGKYNISISAATTTAQTIAITTDAATAKLVSDNAVAGKYKSASATTGNVKFTLDSAASGDKFDLVFELASKYGVTSTYTISVTVTD
ncbi:MAG: hypothetical protein HDT44_06210 [Ruminococcaceae bacterium]|nr:hypothetical protein [Oscillospiraceae bacterium]